jgi:ornithine decarboxylase
MAMTALPIPALVSAPAAEAQPPVLNPRLRDFLAAERAPTPLIAIDLRAIEIGFGALASALPGSAIFYAVKACPQRAVIQALAALGASFDVASRGEIDLCLAAGVPAHRISYGNTIKKRADIADAHARGISLFTTDSEADVQALAAAAPGSGVVCRILVDGSGAQWPLSRKFGCCPEMAADLLVLARDRGLRPRGISFHVGSQQLDPSRWGPAIASAAGVFRAVAKRGIQLDLLNVGGGFPAHYAEPVPPLEAYATAISDALANEFGGNVPQLVCEPGRSLVGDAGVIRSEVVLVSHKSETDVKRWVYLDIGRFGGLAETEGEAIRYPLLTSRDGGPVGPAIVAGPTCDSFDVLYERTPRMLPLDLAPGDTVDILGAGAYTGAYAAAGFNGFRPPRTYLVR